MVTAASTANLAIILIDARKGVLTQTRRHSYLASWSASPTWWSRSTRWTWSTTTRPPSSASSRDYLAFAEQIGITDVRFIPMSALEGDMIVDRGERLSWYDGPTLLDILENAPAAHTEKAEELPLPGAVRVPPPSSANPELHDYRGFMGRVESGEIKVGDSGHRAALGRQQPGQGHRARRRRAAAAIHEQSVTLLLEDEIDISRGDMIVNSRRGARPVKQVEATVCWLSETPLSPARTYWLRHTTREVKAKVAKHRSPRGHQHPGQQEATTGLAMNDIARVTLKLAQPIFADNYTENRATGAFILIDESTNNTVGAGMIVG
jgi:sulfate adenylyltransferase subunit 1